MDQVGVKCGKPTFIEELCDSVDISKLVGQSVSITGKLNMHEVNACSAKLTDPTSKSELLVDTTLIEPFSARIGSLFNLIGELESSCDGKGLVLKARVVRCVDGLDLTLYRKAIHSQRNYMELRLQH